MCVDDISRYFYLAYQNVHLGCGSQPKQSTTESGKEHGLQAPCETVDIYKVFFSNFLFIVHFFYFSPFLAFKSTSTKNVAILSLEIVAAVSCIPKPIALCDEQIVAYAVVVLVVLGFV